MIKNNIEHMQWKPKVIACLASLPLRKRDGGVCRIGQCKVLWRERECMYIWYVRVMFFQTQENELLKTCRRVKKLLRFLGPNSIKTSHNFQHRNSSTTITSNSFNQTTSQHGIPSHAHHLLRIYLLINLLCETTQSSTASQAALQHLCSLPSCSAAIDPPICRS